MDHYILDGHNVVPCDMMTWVKHIEKKDERRVATAVINGSRISTVFLGLDHSFDGGDPMLFETMVFEGALDGEMERCSTWEQAEEMHKKMCERVRTAGTESDS